MQQMPDTDTLLEGPVLWIGRLWDWLGDFWRAMADIMTPLWLGSVVTGIVAGTVTYGVMIALVNTYRKRLRVKLHRLASLRQRRAARRAGKITEPGNGPPVEPPDAGAAGPDED